MIDTIPIVESLFRQIWFFPLVILSSLAIYYFEKLQPQLPSPVVRIQNNNKGVWIAALTLFVIFSAPYWMLGHNAPHGGSDDSAMALQTYLSASPQVDSINWTNGLLGGMDRWLLPNCHPLALERIYALFLKEPYQLYLWVMGINVFLVFIFSWKIQTEFLGVRRWMAYIGATVAVITEGYWTGIYPDAHIVDGHGFAVIIVGIYWLTRFCQNYKFGIVSLLVGLALALSSGLPFHNLPPLLVTVTIWGLVFWGRESFGKVLQANVLIILAFVFILLPQFLAMKFLFATTGRAEVYRHSVDLRAFYLLPDIVLLLIFGIIGAILKIYRQKIVRQVLGVFLGFCAVPACAYVFQSLKIMPAFRWELLYQGNEAWGWLAVIFFIDKIQQAIANRWHLGGIASRVLIFCVCWVLIAFAWMNSLWFDLDSSYPSGTWAALTDTSISSLLKEITPTPVRVVGIDDTNDVHFWGQYQGLESMLGYTPLIDNRKLYFWWFSAMLPSLHGANNEGFLSIPIPVKEHYQLLNFSVPLPVNPDALKLTNVHWIISHHPLYPMSGLEAVIQDPGQPMACTQRILAPSQMDFKVLHNYWQYIGCLFKDYGYRRPLYVYYLQGSLPRVYLAAHVLAWPSGQFPLLTQQELALAAQKIAFVQSQEWVPTKGQSAGDGVHMDDYQSDYMRLGISTRQDALLVVASTLNSYWRVLVDNKPVHAFDVNGFQTGFWVHPENKQAELIYCPPWRWQQHPLCRDHQ